MNRILLIGSESPAGTSLSLALGALGFGVDRANDGNAGMALAKVRRYSHVLIDDELPQEDAPGVFRRLQQLQTSTVGVLLTAVGNLNTVFSAVDAGMRRVLAKPVDFDQLLPLLDPAMAEQNRSFSEDDVASLSLQDIQERLSVKDLISIIRGVDYPFAGKHRLEHFDRDTLERVVHLVGRWCRQRQKLAKDQSAGAQQDYLAIAG